MKRPNPFVLQRQWSDLEHLHHLCSEGKCHVILWITISEVDTLNLPMALMDSPGKSGASSICASLFPSLRAWKNKANTSKSHFLSVYVGIIVVFCALATKLQTRAECMLPPLTRQFQSSASQDTMLHILANYYTYLKFTESINTEMA